MSLGILFIQMKGHNKTETVMDTESKPVVAGGWGEERKMREIRGTRFQL